MNSCPKALVPDHGLCLSPKEEAGSVPSEDVGDDETVDLLFNGGLRMVQKRTGYRFSIDSILLANYVTLKKNERMLDIGSGCGIIPVYLSAKGAGNPMVGIEIQSGLLEVSLKNAKLNCCNNVQFLDGDIRSQWEGFRGSPFNVVVSNPPYTRRETGRRSPGESRCTARHESSLTLEELMAVTSALLRARGRFYVVYPTRRLGELLSVARGHRLEPKRIRFVYPKRGAESNVMLAEFLKDGGVGTIVDRPLYIYDDGRYSEEVGKYYSLKG